MIMMRTRALPTNHTATYSDVCAGVDNSQLAFDDVCEDNADTQRPFSHDLAYPKQTSCSSHAQSSRISATSPMPFQHPLLVRA